MIGSIPTACFTGAAKGADEGLVALISYLKAQNIFQNARFFSAKERQNAGSGSTVRCLGGLTSNDITLTNGPTWGANGLSMSTSQGAEITISGMPSWTSFAVIVRGAPTSASNPNNAADPISWMLGTHNYSTNSGNNGAIRLDDNTGAFTTETFFIVPQEPGEVDGDDFLGLGGGPRIGTSQYTWTASEDHTLSLKFDSSGTKAWKSGTSFSFNLVKPGANSSTDITPSNIGSTATNFNFSDGLVGTLTAGLVIAPAPSDAVLLQIETRINAL